MESIELINVSGFPELLRRFLLNTAVILITYVQKKYNYLNMNPTKGSFVKGSALLSPEIMKNYCRISKKGPGSGGSTGKTQAPEPGIHH